MDFRILGPLEVHTGDGPVAVGGAKPRALLAVLLLHPNEVVSNDRLIEALWGEEPPDTARKSLQVQIYQLRKALGPGVIETRTPGYVLELGDGQVDLVRFQRLREEGRELLGTDPGRARQLLWEALSLWRGPPLSDFAYEPFAQAEIARPEALRVAAVEDRVEADLALGRHAEVIGELEGLINEHPLKERLRGQLMLALYRSGRQAEALDSFGEARRILTEELGIEPSRALRDLQQAILSQDPHLDVPQETGAPIRETSRGVFVGREPELIELVGALEDALAGRGRLVLIAGEPGIGKSRLAEELTGQARVRGAHVLVGRCWEAGGAPAYWPWIQSLRAYVQETDDDALRAQLGRGAPEIAQLLPELRVLYPDLPEPQAPESEGARFRLFDALSSFVGSAARARPLVFVLDDLHAADEPSLLLLRLLAREIADGRVLVVCTFRDVDPAIRAPLSSALGELARESHATQVSLLGLSESDLSVYIERSTGLEPSPGLVRAIHGKTEGNPLFVVETVRLLDAEGRVSEANVHTRIPPGVRAVIRQRVGRLPEPCQGPLVSASVIGREFDLKALALMTELARDQLLDVLDEPMAERVVGEVPGAPGRLRFAHALIRETLYEQLTPARRLQLHRAAGGALEAAYAADVEPHLSELAQHYIAAAPIGMTEKAVAYTRRAADRALSQLAYEEAVRLYEMGLPLVAGPGERCEMLLMLGDAQARAGDTPGANETFHVAADLAESAGLTDQLAQAAIGYGGRHMWDGSRTDERHLPLLERALAALAPDDSPLRVRLMVRLAGGPLRDASFPPERKAAISSEALAMARRLGDPATLAFGIDGYLLGHHAPDNTPRQLDMATELVRVAAEAGDKERLIAGHEERLNALFELGDVAGARSELRLMEALAGEIRQPAQDWFVAVYRALYSLLEGDFDIAGPAISSARDVGERALSWNATMTYGLQLYQLRRFQGRTHEVKELVDRLTDENPTYRIWRCVQAQVAAELGLAAEAEEALAVLAADEFAALPFDEEWLVSAGLIAETASCVGCTAGLEVLYGRLLPFADRVAVSLPEISTGSVARYLGLLMVTMQRWDEAAAHFEDALEVNARIGARPWLAHTQLDYAHILRSRNGPGDAERTQQLLSEAIATYGDLGMQSYAERARLLTAR